MRWSGAEELFLAVGKAGVLRWPLAEKGAPSTVLAGDQQAGGFFFACRLGASASFLVAGSPFAGLTWVELPGGTRGPDFAQSITVDLDVHGNRLLLLGARRDGEKTWAPDGAIAWLGSLDRRLEDLQPVLYSRTPHADGMAQCHFFDHGAVRFLADGSFVVIPGVEPGVFLFGADGKLRHAWEAADAGIDTGCGPAQGEAQATFARDWRLRYTAFLNRQRILDDVVALPAGPGLIVRTVSAGVTRWQLTVLRPGQVARSYPLPVTSGTGFGHLRADARDGVLALLLVEYSEVGEQPAEPRRLLLVEGPP